MANRVRVRRAPVARKSWTHTAYKQECMVESEDDDNDDADADDDDDAVKLSVFMQISR